MDIAPCFDLQKLIFWVGFPLFSIVLWHLWQAISLHVNWRLYAHFVVAGHICGECCHIIATIAAVKH